MQPTTEGFIKHKTLSPRLFLDIAQKKREKHNSFVARFNKKNNNKDVVSSLKSMTRFNTQ